MALDHIVVVGASLAGHWATEALRRGGHEGRITLIGAEPHLPYDRPPLSKAALGPDVHPATTTLRGADHYAARGIELLLGSAATGLDLDERVVAVGDLEVAYDGLVIATGSTVRHLPSGHELTGVEVLRTVEDALRIRAALGRSPAVVVVGAGFIGAEAAAAARRAGCDVTLVEAAPVPMSRAVGEVLGAELAGLHAPEGTELVTGTGVAAFEGDGHVEAVVLDDGRRLAAGLVIVGIGTTPATGWLEGSGLEVRDGVVCDACLRTAPGVVAAGDVARWPNPRYGAEMRIEHWTNAQEQGVRAAMNLLSGPEASSPSDNVPFFWSDQYDHVVQLAGWVGDADETVIAHRGDDGSLVALVRHGDELAAVLTVDRQRLSTRLRRQMVGGIAFDDARAFVRDELAA